MKTFEVINEKEIYESNYNQRLVLRNILQENGVDDILQLDIIDTDYENDKLTLTFEYAGYHTDGYIKAKATLTNEQYNTILLNVAVSNKL